MYLYTSRKGMKYLVDRSDQHPMLAKLPLEFPHNAWWASRWPLLGALSPMLAGGAMALSSVSVVANALLLGRWKPRH
jgi:hypothetical protein